MLRVALTGSGEELYLSANLGFLTGSGLLCLSFFLRSLERPRTAFFFFKLSCLVSESEELSEESKSLFLSSLELLSIEESDESSELSVGADFRRLFLFLLASDFLFLTFNLRFERFFRDFFFFLGSGDSEESLCLFFLRGLSELEDLCLLLFFFFLSSVAVTSGDGEELETRITLYFFGAG